MLNRLSIRFILLLTVAGALPAQADIYSYRDENGEINFTNLRPQAGRYKVHIAYREPKSITRASYPRGGGMNRAIDPPPELNALVRQTASDYAVDRALVQAVIHAESSFNTRALSPKGASGLMQLMPATAERYGVNDIFDPEQNISGGIRYLRDLLKMFNHNIRYAVAAYNAGENSVLRYGGIPPYPETIDYVDRVLKLHEIYRKQS
ncbi:MAG: lytic transglycosylase domain protein [Halothiobacillaceae bacterium]|nr:MAG: lytic transglycosylase domain protein [Halothiobacillaceae bacterium]